MTPGAGSHVGPYDVLGLLGKGGMGEVWHGRDGRLDRDVAIKALPELLAGDEERRQRFEREAKILASLSHPNIAALHGLEEQGGQRYLVMEYVPGTTLDQRLADGAFSVDDALRVCKQIAEALEMAHQKGIVHRDLKPSNVMVLPDDTVKVLDFGLARSAEGSGSTTSQQAAGGAESPTITADFTQPGVVLGTAPYMSPEQARGRSVDKRSDIWSFGVILFECLTGARLFAGETASDTMGAVLHKQLDFDTLPPDTPAMVRVLLRRCLSRDRRDRLQDIGDARIELAAAIADPSGTSLGLATPSGGAAPRSTARNAWLAAAVLAAFVAGGGMTWWIGTGAPTPDSPPPPVQPIRLALDLPPDIQPRLSVHRTHSGSQDFDVTPAGDQVVFNAHGGGFYRRSMGSPECEQVFAKPVRSPTYSPDGRTLVFHQDGAVRVLRPDERAPVTIAELSRGTFGTALGWTSDARLLLAHRGELAVHDLRTGERSLVPGVESLLTAQNRAGWSARRFEPIPQRAHLVLVQFGKLLSSRDHELWWLDLRDGSHGLLLEEAFGAQARADEQIFFLRGSSLTRGTLRLDPEPRVDNLRPALAEPCRGFRITRAGDLLFAPGEEDEFGWHLYAQSPEDGALPISLTPAPGRYSIGGVSPDGRSLLFSSRPADYSTPAEPQLLVQDLGSRTMRSIPLPAAATGFIEQCTWSHDSSRVALMCQTDDGTTTGLYVVRVDGAAPPKLVDEAPFRRQFSIAGWSRPGDRLWYVLGDELVSQPLAAGAEHRRFSRKTLGLQSETTEVSPDGRWLAFRMDAAGQHQLDLLRIADDGAPLGPAKTLARLPGRVTEVRWSADSARIYLTPPNAGARIMKIEMPQGDPDGTAIPEVAFEPEVHPYSWGVGPDGTVYFRGNVKTEDAGPEPSLQWIVNWLPSLDVEGR